MVFFVLVGKIGSGKELLAQKLEKEYNLKVLKLPQFITNEEIDEYFLNEVSGKGFSESESSNEEALLPKESALEKDLNPLKSPRTPTEILKNSNSLEKSEERNLFGKSESKIHDLCDSLDRVIKEANDERMRKLLEALKNLFKSQDQENNELIQCMDNEDRQLELSESLNAYKPPGFKCKNFNNLEAFNNFITESNAISKSFLVNWKESCVIYPIYSTKQLETLSTRAFVRIIYVNCDTLMRYENFKNKYQPFVKTPISLEHFLKLDDMITNFFSFDETVKSTVLKIDNSRNHKKISQEIEYSLAPLINVKDIRPDWDSFFMEIAYSVKMRSNCMKRSVGAVLTRRNRIIAAGYNGTPAGVNNCFDGGCPRCNSNALQGSDLHKCFCVHAEENCLLETGRKKAEGGVIYVTARPCLICTKLLISAGISKVVYSEEYGGNTGMYFTAVGIKSYQMKKNNSRIQNFV